ncbi:hypothetical protein D9757_012695 [Collybiopsis confluens]|uniref:Uncharacterized protein n=1 Tax=Collybiopsis confluens TaxID=2823264 RepID=A0A8H5GJM2_9AGAR|nr:hypothetical protein D9757_012695 [Collybiopsis confluens]
MGLTMTDRNGSATSSFETAMIKVSQQRYYTGTRSIFHPQTLLHQTIVAAFESQLSVAPVELKTGDFVLDNAAETNNSAAVFRLRKLKLIFPFPGTAYLRALAPGGWLELVEVEAKKTNYNVGTSSGS